MAFVAPDTDLPTGAAAQDSSIGKGGFTAPVEDQPTAPKASSASKGSVLDSAMANFSSHAAGGAFDLAEAAYPIVNALHNPVAVFEQPANPLTLLREGLGKAYGVDAPSFQKFDRNLSTQEGTPADGRSLLENIGSSAGDILSLPGGSIPATLGAIGAESLAKQIEPSSPLAQAGAAVFGGLAPGGITGAVKGLGDTVITAKSVGQKLNGVLDSIAPKAYDAAADVGSTIKDTLTNTIEGLKGQASKMWSAAQADPVASTVVIPQTTLGKVQAGLAKNKTMTGTDLESTLAGLQKAASEENPTLNTLINQKKALNDTGDPYLYGEIGSGIDADITQAAASTPGSEDFLQNYLGGRKLSQQAGNIARDTTVAPILKADGSQVLNKITTPEDVQSLESVLPPDVAAQMKRAKLEQELAKGGALDSGKANVNQIYKKFDPNSPQAPLLQALAGDDNWKAIQAEREAWQPSKPGLAGSIDEGLNGVKMSTVGAVLGAHGGGIGSGIGATLGVLADRAIGSSLGQRAANVLSGIGEQIGQARNVVPVVRNAVVPVTSQNDYDNLPSGATYSVNGQMYRKK